MLQQQERKKYILNQLTDKEYVSVRSIAETFGVSEMTGRRDLQRLAATGQLVRTYGGAVQSDKFRSFVAFNRKSEHRRAAKENIAERAARFVEDGETIFLDNGTTIYLMCKHVATRKNLRVITNSLPVVSALIDCPDVKVTLVGGEVVSNRQAIYGPMTERALAEYHANKAFIGTDGISLKKGLTSYDELEANISKGMAESSEEVLLLCDSSKIEKNSYIRFAPLSLIDVLITDSGLDGELAEEYTKRNIEVHLSD